MTRVDWTPQQVALVRSMRAAGCTVAEIRLKLGGTRSMASIHKLIHAERIGRVRRDRDKTPSRRSCRMPGRSTLPLLPSLASESV